MKSDFKKKKLAKPASLSRLAIAVAFTGVGVLATTSAGAQTEDSNAETFDGFELETLVVTGRLRRVSESIQDIPQSVSLVTAEQLDSIGAVTIEELETLTPNLVVDDNGSGAGAAGISLRGLSFEDVEKSQEPTVSVIIDGVTNATNTGLLSNTFDFEKVEVFRGPQGTLFGRNTIGGAINIKRTRPTGETGFRAEVTSGSFGRQEISAVANFGLAENVALKLFGYDAQYDGFYRNVTLGADAGARDSGNVGATILLNPTENLEIELTAQRNTLEGDNPTASLSNGSDLICILPAAIGGAGGTEQCGRSNVGDDPYTVFGDRAGFYDYEADLFNANIDYDFGSLKLTSITAYSESTEDGVQDFDGTSSDFFAAFRPQEYEQFSQEVRLAGEFTERFSGVIGAFYLQNEVFLGGGTRLGPILAAPAGLPFIFQPGITEQELTSSAIFGDFDLLLSDKFTLGFGARYSKDEKDFARSFLDLVNGGVGINRVPNKESWSEVTPRVSLEYTLNDSVLLYGLFSQGFRSGGFNVRANSADTALASFDPETVNSFELGAKTEFADGRGLFNITAFRANYDDKQEGFIIPVSNPLSASGQETIVRNIASAEVTGLEIDARYQFSDYLALLATVGLLDAEYSDFRVNTAPGSPLQDASARPLRRAPDSSYSLSLDLNYPVSAAGMFNANLRYSNISDYQSTLERAPGQPSFGVSDPRGLVASASNLAASIGYTHVMANDRKIYFRLFGRNLTDERGVVAGIPVAGLFTFGIARAPREYGVTVGLDF